MYFFFGKGGAGCIGKYRETTGGGGGGYFGGGGGYVLLIEFVFAA